MFFALERADCDQCSIFGIQHWQFSGIGANQRSSCLEKGINFEVFLVRQRVNEAQQKLKAELLKKA